jgi:hypothetical protein
MHLYISDANIILIADTFLSHHLTYLGILSYRCIDTIPVNTITADTIGHLCSFILIGMKVSSCYRAKYNRIIVEQAYHLLQDRLLDENTLVMYVEKMCETERKVFRAVHCDTFVADIASILTPYRIQCVCMNVVSQDETVVFQSVSKTVQAMYHMCYSILRQGGRSVALPAHTPTSTASPQVAYVGNGVTFSDVWGTMPSDLCQVGCMAIACILQEYCEQTSEHVEYTPGNQSPTSTRYQTIMQKMNYPSATFRAMYHIIVESPSVGSKHEEHACNLFSPEAVLGCVQHVSLLCREAMNNEDIKTILKTLSSVRVMSAEGFPWRNVMDDVVSVFETWSAVVNTAPPTPRPPPPPPGHQPPPPPPAAAAPATATTTTLSSPGGSYHTGYTAGQNGGYSGSGYHSRQATQHSSGFGSGYSATHSDSAGYSTGASHNYFTSGFTATSTSPRLHSNGSTFSSGSSDGYTGLDRTPSSSHRYPPLDNPWAMRGSSPVGNGHSASSGSGSGSGGMYGRSNTGHTSPRHGLPFSSSTAENDRNERSHNSSQSKASESVTLKVRRPWLHEESQEHKGYLVESDLDLKMIYMCPSSNTPILYGHCSMKSLLSVNAAHAMSKYSYNSGDEVSTMPIALVPIPNNKLYRSEVGKQETAVRRPDQETKTKLHKHNKDSSRLTSPTAVGAFGVETSDANSRVSISSSFLHELALLQHVHYYSSIDPAILQHVAPPIAIAYLNNDMIYGSTKTSQKSPRSVPSTPRAVAHINSSRVASSPLVSLSTPQHVPPAGLQISIPSPTATATNSSSTPASSGGCLSSLLGSADSILSLLQEHKQVVAASVASTPTLALPTTPHSRAATTKSQHETSTQSRGDKSTYRYFILFPAIQCQIPLTSVIEISHEPRVFDAFFLRDICRDVFLAVGACNSAGIYFNYVDPEQLYLTSCGRVVLCGLGVGVSRNDPTLAFNKPKQKTPNLFHTNPNVDVIPPEILLGGEANEASSVWSAAAVCVKILTGKNMCMCLLIIAY